MDTNKQESREDKIRRGAEDFVNRFTGVMKDLAEEESHEGVEELLREFEEKFKTIKNRAFIADMKSPHSVEDMTKQKAWLRAKLTPLVAQKEGCCEKCYGGFTAKYGVNGMGGFNHPCKGAYLCDCHTTTPTVKEQKERMVCCHCRGKIPQIISSGHPGKKDGHACFCSCHAPTPTVKEESHTQGCCEKCENNHPFSFTPDLDDIQCDCPCHTQGWNRAESEQCVRANVMHPENGSQESAVRYILAHFGTVIAAIASQEYERGTKQITARGELARTIATRNFEAGRLQGIADVEKWAFENVTHKECFKLLLTALSSLTHKK